MRRTAFSVCHDKNGYTLCSEPTTGGLWILREWPERRYRGPEVMNKHVRFIAERTARCLLLQT